MFAGGCWFSLLSRGLPCFGLGVFAAFVEAQGLVLFPRVDLALLLCRLCVRWVSG